MSNQFLKLRRSAVPGKVPTTSSIDFGEIALNTHDGLAYMKITGSFGEKVVVIGASGSFTGSLFGTASWAINAITASYALNAGASSISGPDYIVPIYSGSNALTSSLIYQSASYTAINYDGTGPNDPNNPDVLFVNGVGIPTYNLISAHSNQNSYVQVNVQNLNNSTEASSDIVATADNGTESENYIDMGINSSGFTNTGNVGGQNDAYLYSTGNDLYIGNASSGKQIIIFNGGLDAANQAKVWIHDQGTVGINTDTYNASNPPSLQVNAPNDTTYNIAQFFGNTDNFAQVGIANANGGTTASTDLALYNNIDYENQMAGFVDLGINSTNYVYNGIYPGAAGDAYLFTDSEHILVGSTSGSGNSKVTLFAGGVSEFENAKLVLYGNNQHQMSGSLNISGSLIVTNGITGSLYGTASWALNSLTASYAPNAVSSSYPIAVTGSTLYSTNPVAGIPSGYATENSIFLGQNAGYSSSGVSYSNFIGYRAGYSASDAYNSNFIGPDAGYEANNAYESHFIGDSAGKYATNANASNFIGTLSGVQAINASYSNFLGRSAGQYASDANNSNFVGQNAGNTATNANDSNFFGQNAGSYATYANRANFIGKEAGQDATYAQYSNFFGDSAGYGATDAVASNFIGSFAGYTANNSQRSNFIGDNAGNNATDAPFSNFIGYQAGAGAYNAKKSVFIGSNPGYNAYNASHSVFIGDETGHGATLAAFSVFLGYNVARSSNIGGNNIIIGTNITLEDNRKDSINLGGLIFATGSYSVTSSIIPFSGSANGRIGINQPNPVFGLDVSGSGRYTNGLTVTSSLIAPSITGSLFGTASWALNSITASYALNVSGTVSNAVSASFATTAISSSYPIAVTGSTLYSFNAGVPNDYSTEASIFLGIDAGKQAPDSGYVNFIGHSAGLGSVNAYEANFIGYQAGKGSQDSYNSNFIGFGAGSGSQDSYNSNYIGVNAGAKSINPGDSNFIGNQAGLNANNAYFSNFIGTFAGKSSTDSYFSNFIGNETGTNTSGSYYSNFIGTNAGYNANRSNNSNFIGQGAGNGANHSIYSNFIGDYAGQNSNSASYSNFIGVNAGSFSPSASYSTFIGYHTGRSSNLGYNNIIIGTNITLENNRKDSINLGGLIFGTGSYATTTGNPFSGSAMGRIGINQQLPEFNLDVSGSGRYTNGLQVTSSLIAPAITGSLQGTASWANNFFTSSVTSASFATTASYALTASFGGNFTASNALINGTITAQTLIVQTITSSVEYVTGSTQFGSLLSNTHQFTGSVSITGSLTVNGTSAILSSQTSSMSVASASIATTSSYAVNADSSSYPIAVTGSTLYSFNAGAPRGNSTNRSVFLGVNAGRLASFADYSTFIGDEAGNGATSASISVFIGSSAGVDSTNVVSSVFIGQIAGSDANRASYSNFIGEAAGQLARSASYSNFMGYNAGYRAQFASHSILIGRFAGANTLATNGIGPNNIVLGTNITVPDNQANSVNIGAIIFATGSYGNVLGNPFSGTTNGRVGINQPNPLFSLDVSGSGRYTTGLQVTGSLIAPAITGSLQGTASWASNFVTSSVTSASYAATASYAVNTFDIGVAEFNSTSSLTVAGTTIVSSINTGSFTSAFYNYTIASGSNARAGQVMSVWSGSSIAYSEVTTTDLGNTATASFAVAISGPTVQLSFTAPGSWRVKSIANLL